MAFLVHMKKNKIILNGAIALGAGAFISKLLGAIYRIPLTNIIGGTGLGLYQMVFPVYAVLLDFSGAGVPSALSKIISANKSLENKYQNAENYLKSSIKILTIIGILGSVLMVAFSKLLATVQGNESAFLGYLAISPAIFLVAIISCYRGYFQGLMDMRPTAISQILEQVVKLIFGLLLAYLFRHSLALSVAGATFAISLSELLAVIYLQNKHKCFNKKLLPYFTFDKEKHKQRVKEIIKTTLPITIIGIIIPLSQVIDSFIIINVLNGYRQDATALYGLLSGVASTVVGLPVSVCYGISAVAIPAVSSSKTEKQKNANALKAILLTLAVALPCAIVCYFFAPLIISILFRRLPFAEKTISINLLKTISPCVVLLSLLQTGNAVLIGKGKLYKPVFSLVIGVVVKIIVSVVLLKNPTLNIYGGAIGVIACYFVASLINFIMIFKLKVNYERKTTCRREYAS